jgi:hypothetical protein
MRIEYLPGMTNVVRFPVEQRARPSLELLREIAPDCREIDMAAEVFDFDGPLTGIREAADEGMAEYILNHVPPEAGARRRAALDDLLTPLVTNAVNLCRRWREAMGAAGAAWQKFAKAKAEGGYWLEPLEERALWWREETARRMVEAYIALQEAEGAARAIGLAMRGEPWQPFDPRAEAEALFFGNALQR